MPIAPTTKTVQSILTRVKRQFGDEAGAQITDADIIGWINSGQDEIARRNKIFKDQATTPVIAATRQYSFPVPRIMSVEMLQFKGIPLKYVSFQHMKEYVFDQDPEFTMQGDPTMWYEWGNNLYIYPTPATTTIGDLTLYYYSYPVAVDDAADTLSVPDSYYDTLLQYCLAQAYEQDDDWTGSAQKQTQVNDSLNLLSRDGVGYNRGFYDTITILEEDA